MAGPDDDDADDAGMDTAELKKLLVHARKGPVQVAFATGSDGKIAVQLDRRKQAKALVQDMKKADPGSKEFRFGTVEVDEKDPKLVRFALNKAGGSLARKLKVALKGTGFSKVEVTDEA